jgi:hypothetical protein
MLASIETIRAIERRCRSQKPLSREQSQWLGEALSAFLEHKTPSIDSALGLANPRGGVPWWLEEAIRTRNAALCDLARDWFADLSASAQAERIWTLATRYAASAWRFDAPPCRSASASCARSSPAPRDRGKGQRAQGLNFSVRTRPRILL